MTCLILQLMFCYPQIRDWGIIMKLATLLSIIFTQASYKTKISLEERYWSRDFRRSLVGLAMAMEGGGWMHL